MGFRLVLTPYEDPATRLDWHEQTPIISERVQTELDALPFEVQAKLESGDQGIGADWPILIIEVISLGSVTFFGVPKLYKKIKEAAAGWYEIWSDMRRLIDRLKEKEHITRYSIEVAFYYCLGELSSETNVDELELLEAKEILGRSGLITPSFENTQIVYYMFIFRDGDTLRVLWLDERLRFLIKKELELDIRTRLALEESAG